MNAHFFRLGFQAHLWYKLWIISIDKRKGLLSDFMWMGWPGVIIFGSHPQSENFTHWLTGTTGSQISIPRIFGTGFCQIPGSRDFSGRDFPIFLIPGFKGNFSGYFGIFIFASFPCQIRSLSSNQYPENDQNSISERSSTLKQHALKNYQSDQCLAIFIISLL